MKNLKTLLLINLLITTLFFSNGFSQDALKKGVYTLGGSIAYSYSKSNSKIILSDFDFLTGNFITTVYDNTITNNEILISPSFSIFLIDNLMAGADIIFNYIEINNEISNSRSMLNPNSKTILRNFGIGPKVRYYFSGMSIIPFGEIGYSYLKNISTEESGNTFQASAGINCFLSNSVALEPFLSYSITYYNKQEREVSRFSVGVRINYFIVN